MLKKPKLHGRLYPTLIALATLAVLSLALGACVTPRVASTTPPAPPPPEVEKPAEPQIADVPVEPATIEKQLTEPMKPPVPVPPPSAAVVSDDREELLKYQEAVRVYREEGRAEEAFEMLKAFLRMHPKSNYADDALLEQARIMVHLDNPRTALSLINTMLHDFPNSPLRKRAFLESGKIYYNAEKWRDCIQSMESVLVLDPLPDERFEAQITRAECLLKKRDFRAAFEGSREAYHAALNDEDLLQVRGVLALTAAGLKDKDLERILEGSDGTEPYGYLATERLERLVDEGMDHEALNELMDIIVHYPGQLPEDRISEVYGVLSDRLLVRSNTVGAILPLSGRYQVYGEKALQGIQTALGLMYPLPDEGSSTDFNLVLMDSGAEPMKAAQAVRDLVEHEQVLAIIGPLFSRTSKAAAEAAEESGVPLITLSADPSIPDLGENIFRRTLSDSQQIKTLVRMVHDRLMMTRFAFLYPNNSYGKEMVNLFWDELDARGAVVVAAESFPPGQTDFGPQIRAMVGLNRKLNAEEQILKESGVEIELEPIVDFDALFIPADFQTIGLLAPQLAFYDVTSALLLGTNGWNSPWMVEFGEHYVEGALFTGSYLADMENQEARVLAERYWISFGEDPQPLAIQGYDAALLIRSGVEAGLVRDRSSLRTYLMNLSDFPSAEGPLTTLENGDIVQSPFLLTVEKGNIKRFELQID
jgi:ABC-type branched-subunit amino acid transport system substrate-binding protein